MAYASNNYKWNESISKHRAMTFYAFLESYHFRAPAVFYNYPRLQLLKDR